MTQGRPDGEDLDRRHLRWEAAERLRHAPADLSGLASSDLRQLIHELEVHRAELEVQNEELRRTQAELTEARNRFEDLYHFAPVGYLTLDEQGRILQSNLAMEWLCNVVSAHLTGRRMESVLCSDDHDACYLMLRKASESGSVRTEEFRLDRGDGELRWVSVTASPLARAGRRDPVFRVTFSDIHTRKQAEAALQASERQLRELTRTLEQRVAERTAQLQSLANQLGQAEQRERHRLAKILHDHLQQVLVGAKYSLNIVRNRAVDEDLLKSIHRVNELLDESIATSRSLTAEMSPPILYAGTMRQVLEWLARWVQEKHGLSVALQVDDDANMQSETFRVLVFGVVRELLLNVAKHASTPSASIVMKRSSSQRVQVVVADRGIGFDPGQVRTNDASGFGLFGIRERLEALGGEIHIESSPGKGTRISMSVPADLATGTVESGPEAPGPLAEVPAHPFALRERTEPRGDPQTIRVLLADDHAVLRDGLAQLLDLQPGIEVVGRASDGQQALEMALRLQPDVVVMDVSMPRLTGMEATRRILAQRPAIRIIGLSMHADPDIAAAMREAGASEYLAKTTQPEVLVATIRKSGRASAASN